MSPPESDPPDDAEGGREPIESVLRRYLSLPPVRITTLPPPSPPKPVDRSASTIPAVPTEPAKVEHVDSQLAEIEPLLKRADWAAVADALSKQETLRPPLALLYALALRERDAAGDPEGIAIRAVAALLCVPEESETALVVAKRLLRKNPIAWQRRPAPSARVSLLIVLIVLVFGAIAGFFFGPGGLVLR